MLPRRSWIFSVLLLIALAQVTGAQVVILNNGNGNGNGNNAHKRQKQGNYSVNIAGQFTGSGSAVVADTISMTVNVVLANGSSGTLVISGLAIDDNGYFKGTGTVLGVTMTVSGRVDLPAGYDDEQSAAQNLTGRISAVFKASNGKCGRIMGVQNDSVTGVGGNGKNK